MIMYISKRQNLLITLRDRISGWMLLVLAGLLLVPASCRKIEGEKKVKLVTGTVSGVSYSTCVITGEIVDLGGKVITEHGFCFSTEEDPTISGDRSRLGTISETASFSDTLDQLSSGTTYYVRAYAEAAGEAYYGDQKTFSTLDAGAPVVTTASVSGITGDGATCGGNVSEDRGSTVSARGVCWSTSQDPVATGPHTSDGQGTGEFVSQLTGLDCNTTYYIRAYATNQSGTSYGDQVTFTTSPCKPVVSTIEVSDVTGTSAGCGGNVTDNGGGEVTSKGVCWGTESGPTNTGPHTTDGSGTGSFTSVMEGLSCGTEYYVRAYATNQAGTSYGEERSFTTSVCIITAPAVVTLVVDSVTDVSATSGGNVTDDGGDQLTERGVCWSTWHTPTIDQNRTLDGMGAGSFHSQITGLDPSTTYYVRAYAKNSHSTSYGEIISFTTLDEVVVDVDGNVYAVVEILNQTWMAENLRTTRYNDGTSIPYATDNNRYVENYCWYNHDRETNGELYGALYSAPAASSEKLCPAGWHIPSYGEWQTLAGTLGILYEGGSPTSGQAMAATTGWDISTTAGSVGYDQASNNASGFNARPAGFLFGAPGFTFKDMGYRTMWYPKVDLPMNETESPYRAELKNSTVNFSMNTNTSWCEIIPCVWPSFSIRCVKDQ